MKRGSTPTMVEWAILAWVAGKKITISQWGQSFFIHRVAPKEIYCSLHKNVLKKAVERVQWNGSE